MEKDVVKTLVKKALDFIKEEEPDGTLFYNGRLDKVWVSHTGDLDSRVGFEDLLLCNYYYGMDIKEFKTKLTKRLSSLKVLPDYLQDSGLCLSMLTKDKEEQYKLLIHLKILKSPFDKKVLATFGETSHFFNWIRTSLLLALKQGTDDSEEIKELVEFIYPSNFYDIFKSSGCLELLNTCVESNSKTNEHYIIQSRLITVILADHRALQDFSSEESDKLLKLIEDNKEKLSVWLPVGTLDRLMDKIVLPGYSKLIDKRVVTVD